jgi:thioester reductase-like protein
MTYFVTGATGFIGKRLIERLLERSGDIYVLAREQSVEKVAALWNDPRIKPVIGDLGRPLLGVDPAALQGITQFFHLAALYDMTASAEANDLANVAGTRHAVELANALGATLHHVSSVAVAGEHRGLFREDHFAEGQKLPTAYHRTKYESEAIVRAEATTWRVYRPGVVVGDSRTGEMDKIDGPYYFFTAIKKVRHLLPEWVPLIGPELGWTNIVPVDFVAAALDHIAHADGLDGQAFHLTDPRGIRVGEALNAFARGGHAPQLGIRVDTKLLDLLPKGAFSMLLKLPQLRDIRKTLLADLGIPDEVIGHMALEPQFDTRDTERALGLLRREALGLLGAHPGPLPLQGPLVREGRHGQARHDHRWLLRHRGRGGPSDRRGRWDPDHRGPVAGQAARGADRDH